MFIGGVAGCCVLGLVFSGWAEPTNAPHARAELAAAASLEPSTAATGLRLQSAELQLPQPPNWPVPIWHSVALMTTMRASEAWLWPNPFAETDLGVIGDRYSEAFTRPPKWDASRKAFEWDGDRWWINAVGHPLFGSELYYRPRRCGHGPLAALAIVTAGSTLWEYGYEANGVRPSGLDLWFTPVSGALLGEARFLGYSAASRVSQPAVRTMLKYLFDPFGQIERAFGTPC